MELCWSVIGFRTFHSIMNLILRSRKESYSHCELLAMLKRRISSHRQSSRVTSRQGSSMRNQWREHHSRWRGWQFLPHLNPLPLGEGILSPHPFQIRVIQWLSANLCHIDPFAVHLHSHNIARKVGHR